MGGLLSKKNRDYHASEKGYPKRAEVYSPSSASYMYGSGNGDSRTLDRSYPTSTWSSTPSSSSMDGYSVGGSKTSSSGSHMHGSGNGDSRTLHGNYPTSSWSSTPSSPSVKGYSVGGSKTKSCAVNSLNAVSNGRYGDLDSKTTLSRGYDAAVGLKPNKASANPVSRSASDRGCTIGSVKPVLPKSHGTNNTLASLKVSTEGSCSTGRWSIAPAANSVLTGDVERESIKRFSAGGAGRGRGRGRGRRSGRGSGSGSGRGRGVERHATANRRPPSTTDRNHGGYHESDGSRRVATYGAKGGGRVVISVPLNPWEVLGLQSSSVSREAVKAAFKRKITQPLRQNRAMVSIAYHMLTSSAGRYTRVQGKDEFVVRRRDHFMLAACGHTKELTLRIDKKKNLVQERDEHGRTLLYIASKSGFYDTCKLLLEKGAPVNQAQKDGSTPLHGAAYFGHALVVGLLLQHGARIDIKNSWGNSALDESATPAIRNLIQSASADDISSVAASLKEKKLVLSVRHIEYQGEVIAKELTRDPRTLDADTRADWNRIHNTWETAWHGTRYKYLDSIIQKGLLPAGSSGIKPAAGHYSLGEEHFGIANWAAAIFLSPSILYAAHVCYSDRVFSESQQWCVLVKAYCKPGSYKSYDPTVFSYKPMDGEPVMPEYRIPVHEADKNVILRVESTRSVVVRSLMFVRLSFLENQDMNFDQAMRLLR